MNLEQITKSTVDLNTLVDRLVNFDNEIIELMKRHHIDLGSAGFTPNTVGLSDLDIIGAWRRQLLGKVRTAGEAVAEATK